MYIYKQAIGIFVLFILIFGCVDLSYCQENAYKGILGEEYRRCDDDDDDD